MFIQKSLAADFLRTSMPVILAFCMAVNYPVTGQDPVFSQIFTNLASLNPGYAGSSENIHAGMGYRNQWPELGNAYISYSAYYDQPLELIHGGAGIYVINDRQGKGAFNRLQAGLIYAYEIQIKRYFAINAGLECSWIRKSINASNFVFPDMISGGYTQPTSELLNNSPNSFPDFSFGVIGSYRSHYFGLAVHHLFAPAESNSPQGLIRLDRKYSILAGTNIEFGSASPSRSGFALSPAVYAEYQASNFRLVYGSYLSYKPVFIGIWLRNQLPELSNIAISLHIGTSFSIVRIAYSYEFLTRTSIGIPDSGIHEITLSFRTPYESKGKKIKAIKCPKI